jgi:glyoxylase-like metal-dependent hydrolase (beta-lactamase superfamily II)
VSPGEVVERVGVKASDVPLCLISHLHYDHWAGHTLFPNAQFWIQKDEVAFWTGRHAGTPAFRGSANVPSLANLVTLNYQNRIKIIDGAHEVLPGIRVHKVGGHTAGLQIVSVETARGPVILTSDASHFYHNIENRQPVQIITSLPEMLDAFETIDELAGKAAPRRRRPRPRGGHAVQGREAGGRQDRLTVTRAEEKMAAAGHRHRSQLLASADLSRGPTVLTCGSEVSLRV